MREARAVRRLPWTMTPLEAAARWPGDRALFMLHSGRVDERWARWSILASPRAFYQFDGRSKWIGDPPGEFGTTKFVHEPLRDLHAVLTSTSFGSRAVEAPMNSFAVETSTTPASLAFRGGWIGCFSYDLGRWIETAAQDVTPAFDDRHWPLIMLAYCPDALVFDHVHQCWHAVGEPDLELSDDMDVFDEADFEIGALSPGVDPDRYMSMVGRTIKYIVDGDIFQANIAQRFTAAVRGSTRALAIAAMQSGEPWYGANLEWPDGDDGVGRTIVSLSPELFLHTNPCTRRVFTRPIKGTRPTSASAQQLADSAKDAAELHMIVDLMRNDLGRVCEFGSVRVPCARMIETHPTVHHGVGEVTGRLRSDVNFCDLLRATFPGGSVTGAPKIRAMRIIDELEPVQRGPYCGAIGFISDCGAASLSIAIRTMLLTGRREPSRFDRIDGLLDYSAGAGIVADSEPLSEYRETLDKTAALRGLWSRTTSATVT
jgi:para-aminobenzoate synthetase component I